MMFQRKVRRILGFFLFSLLLLGTSPLFAQFTLEANLGLNLFDIVGSKATFNAKDTSAGTGTAEATLTMPTMVAFGITAGQLMSSWFFGGELAYYSGTGSSSSIKGTGGFLGTGTIATGGNADCGFLRIGPVVRYYFGGPGLKPFVGAAIDYENATWTPSSGVPPKFSIGLIDIAAMGGVSYDFNPNLYIAGFIRLGYYLTISPATVTFPGEPSSTTITASQSWLPAVLAVGVGYKF